MTYFVSVISKTFRPVTEKWPKKQLILLCLIIGTTECCIVRYSVAAFLFIVQSFVVGSMLEKCHGKEQELNTFATKCSVITQSTMGILR